MTDVNGMTDDGMTAHDVLEMFDPRVAAAADLINASTLEDFAVICKEMDARFKAADAAAPPVADGHQAAVDFAPDYSSVKPAYVPSEDPLALQDDKWSAWFSAARDAQGDTP